MQDKTVCNLIISGIGGQGINSLALVLADYFYQSGYGCQFTIHKGGAQSLDSVYAEFRISKQELAILGPGIPHHQLDILIALEPWEALRHLSLAHSKTLVYVETEVMPLFTERDSERITKKEAAPPLKPPKKQLQDLPLHIQWQSYRKTALEKNGIVKMANYYAGLDCLTAIKQLFVHSSDNNEKHLFDQLFFKQIKKAKPLPDSDYDTK